MLKVSEKWRTTYPTAMVGVLAMEAVENPAEHALLNKAKVALEAGLRKQYAEETRTTLEALPAIQPYVRYYKKFGNNYHVLFQLESVVKKGKGLPGVAALVEAMFMAELKDQLLTAGHDLDTLQLPIFADVAEGTETYEKMNGKMETLKKGDMFVADQSGITSSILYGPDKRTAIKETTRRVLFIAYGPEGVKEEKVREHLEEIRKNILIITPDANTISLEIAK